MIESFCAMKGIQGPLDDIAPVVLTEINVSELGADLMTIQQMSIQGSFKNSNSFIYNPYADEENTLKGAIGFYMRGVNQLDQMIDSRFVIRFSNECGVSVLEVGDIIGWAIVVSQVQHQ